MALMSTSMPPIFRENVNSSNKKFCREPFQRRTYIIGMIPEKGSFFVAVLARLRNEGELVGPGLSPSGKLKAGVDEIITQRAEIAARSDRIR
jgi:hypothetical protein